MGIRDVVRDKSGGLRLSDRLEKFRRDDLCPVCGGSDTEEIHYYWRCNDDSCDAITYITTNWEW